MYVGVCEDFTQYDDDPLCSSSNFTNKPADGLRVEAKEKERQQIIGLTKPKHIFQLSFHLIRQRMSGVMDTRAMLT
jgi:hypothetical protein